MPRKRHTAEGIVNKLREADVELAVDFAEGLDDLDLAAEHVEASDLQCEQLADAEAGVRGGENESAVAQVDGRGEVVDLVGREEAHLLALHLGELDASAGGSGYQVRVDGGIEGGSK